MDEVWVLPVYVHAFQAKRAMPSFEHRMAMARLAFEHLPGLEDRVRVLDIERRVAEAAGRQTGTIDVIEALQVEHPDAQLALLLGADTYRDLISGRWKRSKDLRNRIPVIVVPRQGQEKPESSSPDAPSLSDVSSSAVRDSDDIEVWRAALQPSVLAYIQRHQLYTKIVTALNQR